VIKNIAIFTLFLLIGVAGYVLVSPFIPVAVTQLSPLTTRLQSGVTGLQAAWSTLPASVQGVVMLAIPSGFAMFFAWTKSRAMLKLQQTQQQATTQATQLQNKTVEAQNQLTVNTQLQQSNLKLQQDLTTALAQNSNVTDLQTKITGLQENVSRLTNENNTLAHELGKKTEDMMKRVLEEAKRV